jgi:putative transposase
MDVKKGHRKLVKHFDDPKHVRELTFSCYRRMPLLTDDVWREMLSRAIDAAADQHHWQLTAFVFMPEHLHLVLYPLPEFSTVEHLLKAIKRPFSYRIKQILVQQQSPLLDRLTIRQRPAVTTFRYWQEGPGYDRNLESERAVLAAIDYCHLNPVRRGYCQCATKWRWSSARFYAEPSAVPDSVLPRLYPLPPEFFT